MKLDIHTHILPDNLPNLDEKYGYPGWISIQRSVDKPNVANMYKNGQLFRCIEKNCWCLNERCKDMSRDKVDVQVLSTVPVMFNYWAKPEHTLDLCHLLNDDLAHQILNFRTKAAGGKENGGDGCDEQTDVVEGKEFYGFGTLPMQDPQLAVEELTRCHQDLGMKGIQIGSHINDWNLDEKKLYPIWKRAEDLDCPIFVHPWDMDHISRTHKYWLPWLVGMPAETATAICCLIMGNVLNQFPRLKFCFAHGGGSFPFTVGRIQHGYDVRPDLCATECPIPPRDFLGKFYTDSLVHSQSSLDLLIDVIGEDKVILGTDYPFPLGELEPGKLIESSSQPQRVKDKLLFKNGLEFLNIKS